MEAHSDEYEQVLCTDTRDVIFQDVVFKYFIDAKNYLAYATQPCAINPIMELPQYNWMTKFFSKSEADKLIGKKVICAGTVIGTVNEMKIFCRKILEYKPKLAEHGADEATEHYFIYNNLLPIKNLIETDCHSGAIFTSHWFHMCNPVETRGDKILRGDGGVPAVVHAYRQKSLIQLVDNVYRDRNFRADERFTDPRSVVEQVKQLVYIGKTDEAARIFMGVHGANFDGNVELLIKIWEMLLNRPLTPVVGYLELSMQNALASVKNFPIQYLNATCSMLTYSIKNRRTVDPQLVQFIAGSLMNLAEQSLNARNAEFCFFCTNAIKSFDLPPNKDFYLLQAKAYRTFGRKDEALAAYQKALDLS